MYKCSSLFVLPFVLDHKIFWRENDIFSEPTSSSFSASSYAMLYLFLDDVTQHSFTRAILQCVLPFHFECFISSPWPLKTHQSRELKRHQKGIEIERVNAPSTGHFKPLFLKYLALGAAFLCIEIALLRSNNLYRFYSVENCERLFLFCSKLTAE